MIWYFVVFGMSVVCLGMFFTLMTTCLVYLFLDHLTTCMNGDEHTSFMFQQPDDESEDWRSR